ncbi:hypothetical protein [Candidatus Palauibacter sp.]|uniref:hypothetical protein n=1 Tax=Candidatus Palauibacter sp. TaxID=3101350 RepID=UPI003B0287EB
MINEPWGSLPEPDRAFYRSPESGLFLPVGHSPDHGQQTSDLTGVLANYHEWVSWSNLYGSAPTYDEVVARLRPYGLESVLETLGAISGRISMPEGGDPVKPQREIISWVFDDPRQLGKDIETWRTDIANAEFGVPTVKVFHELQLVTAAKIALLKVPPTHPDGPSSLQGFGEALLMVTDLIDLHTQSHELAGSILEDSDLARWIGFVVPNRLFHGGDNLRNALARSHDLYLTDRPHLRSKTAYINLPEWFERITGVTPDLAWAAMFRVFANTRTAGPQALLTADTFREELNLSSDEERAVFALFAAHADTLREKLVGSGCGADNLRVFDPLPFGETPVVVHDGKAFCPSVAFLRRKMTRGWFHIFLTGLEDKRERKRFLDYMGPVFEDYIDTLLRRVFPKVSARYVGPDFLDSPALHGSKKCDAVIVYEDSAVLIEVKATLLHLPVWRDGDISALSEKIDDIIGDSAEQFGGTIRLIEEGHLKEQGVDPSQIESYLPLVVTLETMPNDFMVYRLIEQRTRRQAMLERRKARPIQWADVGDIESLETLLGAGHSLHDILMARLEDCSYREESLGNWLIRRYGSTALGPNPYLKRRFDEVVAPALEQFRSRRPAD